MQKDLFKENSNSASYDDTSDISTYEAKEKIIRNFKDYISGQHPPENNTKHDGFAGHWLERRLGKDPDSDNTADFWGYECKNYTKSKTTWGDWSPNYYIFEDNYFDINRDQFIKIFGKFNPKKERYSWSGEPVPSRYGDITGFGQSLIIEDNKDISIYYNYNEDKRDNKASLVPEILMRKKILLAKWHSLEKNNFSKKTSLEVKVNNKFNQRGWFKCVVEDNKYSKIVFGDPINIYEWISLVKKGEIFFDSGMYQGNNRHYSQWRSNNIFWDSLIKEEFF